jgi:hypothetical protein
MVIQLGIKKTMNNHTEEGWRGDEEVKGVLKGSPLFYGHFNIKLIHLSKKYSVAIVDLGNNNILQAYRI